MTLGMQTYQYVRALRGEEPYSSAMNLLIWADTEDEKYGKPSSLTEVIRKAASELCIGGEIAGVLVRMRGLLLQAVEAQYNDMGEPPLVHGDTIKRIIALENRTLLAGFIQLENADEASSVAHLCRMAKFDTLAERFEAAATAFRR